jgi:hypothetical protein
MYWVVAFGVAALAERGNIRKMGKIPLDFGDAIPII